MKTDEKTLKRKTDSEQKFKTRASHAIFSAILCRTRAIGLPTFLLLFFFFHITVFFTFYIRETVVERTTRDDVHGPFGTLVIAICAAHFFARRCRTVSPCRVQRKLNTRRVPVRAVHDCHLYE